MIRFRGVRIFVRLRLFASAQKSDRSTPTARCICPPKNNQRLIPLYIINFEEIAYHQDEVLYVIIAKAFIQPAADDMHASRDDMRLTAMICHCFRNG